ncbi:PrgI family protein [Candidatus Protofrankia californiensis]|uniref:PrgI family protein n=1 Tax=Candidatus Protofrankia californiensis TaxID=1839754 RepID=UPI001F49DC8C|nr:PrgI family protein [Candidatus Protofrankia californiensis]
MTHPVRIPADVDREDRIVANLTARQVLILALTGIAVYLGWAATRSLVPLPVFALLAVPVAAGAGVLVLGQRDGLSLDRMLVAAIRQRTSPRHRINAPEGVLPPPSWLATRATSSSRDLSPSRPRTSWRATTPANSPHSSRRSVGHRHSQPAQYHGSPPARGRPDHRLHHHAPQRRARCTLG